MSQQFEKSPFLDAQDLLSLDMESMTLDDLEYHLRRIREVILRLTTLTLYPGARSAYTTQNLHRLLRNLQARLDDALSLMECRKVEAAASEVDEGRIRGRSWSRPQ